MILSNKQITKALIRLSRCAGWSAHACLHLCCSQTPQDKFSRIVAQILCLKSSFPVLKPEYFFIPSTEHTKAHFIKKHLHHFKNSILNEQIYNATMYGYQSNTTSYYSSLHLQIMLTNTYQVSKYINVLQYIFVYIVQL